MVGPDNSVELLKEVLGNLLDQQSFDSRLWADSRLVNDPDFSAQSRGHRLIAVIDCLFRKMKLPMPPKRGKHLEDQTGKVHPRSHWNLALAIIGLTLMALLIVGALKGWEFYKRLVLIKQKVDALEVYQTSLPKADQISEVASQIHDLRLEVESLNSEAGPYLGFTPYLGWVPTYGGDLVQAPELLKLAVGLARAADDGVLALQPGLKAALQKDQPLDILVVLESLQVAEPDLLNAQVELAQAQAARDRIDTRRLSPYLQKIIEARLDPLLESIAAKNFPMEDALALVHSAPRLLGIGKTGPQTYLLMVQNEDELRPTGGYLTAVGSVVVKDGKLLSINIESSELVDDLSRPYPKPPWQLDDYMMAKILLLRDANWFTDFPTTVKMVEYLYSYSRAYSVDGVIAIDQHVVVELLKALGPINVQGVSYQITSENVLSYMRAAKESAPPGVDASIWNRKQFIGRLAKPLLEKILDSRGTTLRNLAQGLIQLLDERHILLQFDDPETTGLLARRKWDGAVHPPADSDYLMVVDSNIGFNKSNAVLETSLTYNVNLTDLTRPLANLTVSHTNQAAGDIPCIPIYGEPDQSSLALRYIIDGCHWTYLRVYNPAGTQLLGATPQAVPADQTLREIAVPARVDILDEEGIPGVQAFGSLVVIPQQKTVDTTFDLRLPGEIVHWDPLKDTWTYRLLVQKQPGTLAIPLNISLSLPAGAALIDPPAGIQRKLNEWVLTTDLKQDVDLEIVFRVPK
jgi:hypothetical protein